VSQEAGPGVSPSTTCVPPARRYSNAAGRNYIVLPAAIKPTGSLELAGYVVDETPDNSAPRYKGKHV
jgi:hypothetical protein